MISQYCLKWEWKQSPILVQIDLVTLRLFAYKLFFSYLVKFMELYHNLLRLMYIKRDICEIDL